MKTQSKELLKTILIVILFFTLIFGISLSLTAQTVGTVKTEQYKAKFEKDASIDTLPEYHSFNLIVSSSLTLKS